MQTTDRAAWIRGGTICCDVEPTSPVKACRLVLLGAPGSGKGTQAELLGKHLGACHLSTGDIFRAAKNAARNEAGPAMNMALECMKRGELVSDDTVLAVVAERAKCLRCLGGFLLDGFPRTVAQAMALDKVLARQSVTLDAVLSYELPLKSIVARLTGRRTCLKCKAVFHIEARPPAKAGLCDHCGSPLYQRDDDRPEAIRVRMEAYERSTAPLTEFYRMKGLLISISAEGSPEQIFMRSVGALDDRSGRPAAG
jgi:adenylate kinase